MAAPKVIPATETIIKSTPKAKAASTPQTVVYIGPSFPKGELSQYTVFNNGVPKFLEDHTAECAAIKSLIVPVEQLATARKNLSVTASAEHTLYAVAQAYIRGDK